MQAMSGLSGLSGICRSVQSLVAGPNNPTSGVSAAGANVAWTNPGNILSSNNTYATASLRLQQTNGLQATGFNFSIPAGATITSIRVQIERKEQAAAGQISDLTVTMLKAGALVGTPKGGISWFTSDTVDTYQGDLWGTTWTYSDINHAQFGVELVAAELLNVTTVASVDHIKITVFYDL